MGHVTVLALLVVGVLAPAVGATDDAALAVASPDCGDLAPAAPFSDVAGSTHEPAIRCLATWRVTSGHDDGSFRPNREVSRAQVATFVHRLLGAVGRAPSGGEPRFKDIGWEHSHARGVNALAAADILRGTAPATFDADTPMTRGQLATVLSRTHEVVFGGTLPDGAGTIFADTAGTTHETSILRLATAEVVTGYADGTFGPDRRVTRGQMATFLHRYATLLIAEGLVDSPASELLAVWESTPPDPAWHRTRHFGVATPGNGWETGELEAVADLAGHRPSLVLHYLGFDDELQLAQLEAVRAAGATSLLTWEPYDWRAGTTDQPRFRLQRILDGEFDDHLRRTAATIGAFGSPVLLRFAHEMNGDWYPWSEQVNGNRPGDYVAAWRHVHGLFVQAGVSNVEWVWSPNVEYAGSQPLAQLYPGDDYVDAIAVDGYNWGTAEPWSWWQSPAEVFDPTLQTVRQLAPAMPLMIGETASTELGGDKAAWVEELFSWLEDNRDVRALVWFHLDKETDWRIDSSPAAARSLAQGLASWPPAS